MLRENEIISNVLLSVDEFKGRMINLRQAVALDLYCQSSHYSRSLVWKVCLLTDTLNIQKWEQALQNTRIVYGKLIQRPDLAVPWGSLAEDHPFYLADPSSLAVGPANDPLGDGQFNADLLSNITLDIERLFPGNEFFHSDTPTAFQHKKTLVQILYIWAKCNLSIGYKQGLHEIVGLIYLNLHAESIVIPNTNTISKEDKAILRLFNLKYLAHDVFVIFNKFALELSICTRFYDVERGLMESILSFNALLMKTDQLIHYTLTNKLKIELQLWVIRYWRLLLSRELGSLEMSSKLWDKLVVLQPLTALPTLIDCIIITMLIHIKTMLLTDDFSEALLHLLHYPIDQVAGKYASTAAFINSIYKDGYQMFERRDNDLKLYEYGAKLNGKYNKNITITFEYGAKKPAQTREEQVKFEKMRLEMRLKKRAQEMIKK